MVSDSSMILSYVSESSKLFTLAAFECKDYRQTRRKQ